ncbi:MAG: polysaccharide deacetylase [Clostridia bacterium]|nr:polysaccharide deacetylase [Clostridia bacterium]
MDARQARIDERRRKRKRQERIFYCVFFSIVLLLLVGIFFGVRGLVHLFTKKDAQSQPPVLSVETVVYEADLLAAGYDYDAAIAKIKACENYANEPALTDAISRYEAVKATLVPANISEVTHVFFHTLIKDNAKCFDGEYTQDGYNQYMTTISEFNKIIAEMHARGYVLVNLSDMAVPVVAEDGSSKMQAQQILLPPGKKPFVMSQDDVSYYRYMTGDGFASRLVIGEDGYPTCEYVEDDGSVVRGDFDLVPLLETFIKAHPDFSYRGARATLAITGYDGVLGYRTCPSGEDYNPEDVPKAKAVADRMRELGWVFASHSWGHRLYGSIDVETLRTDAQKWESEVRPILGDTNILIYAHGEDIAGIEEYAGEKYEYLKSLGFCYFCNVDAHPYWVQLRDGYLRQGRRNLDGYRMYYAPEMVNDLFEVSAVWDTERPTPVPPIG